MDSAVNKIINSNGNIYSSDVIGSGFQNGTGVSASFTTDAKIIEQGNIVSFINTSTGFITSSKWYVNDVLVSSDTNLDYYVTQEGTNVVELVVSGGSYSSSCSETFEVGTSFFVDFTYNVEQSGVPSVLSFYSSVSQGLAPFSYSWYYRICCGDWVLFGSTVDVENEAFSDVGLYDIKLVAIDSNNLVSERIKYDIFSVSEDSVSFTSNVVEGDTPLLVNFMNTSNVLLAESYEWFISGDGDNWVSVGNDYNMEYTFYFPSLYSVKLVCTTASGNLEEIKYNYITAGDIVVGGVTQENFEITSVEQDGNFDVAISHGINTLFITGVSVLDADNEEIGVDFVVVDASTVLVKYNGVIVGTHKAMIQGIKNY